MVEPPSQLHIPPRKGLGDGSCCLSFLLGLCQILRFRQPRHVLRVFWSASAAASCGCCSRLLLVAVARIAFASVQPAARQAALVEARVAAGSCVAPFAVKRFCLKLLLLLLSLRLLFVLLLQGESALWKSCFRVCLHQSFGAASSRILTRAHLGCMAFP